MVWCLRCSRLPQGRPGLEYRALHMLIHKVTDDTDREAHTRRQACVSCWHLSLGPGVISFPGTPVYNAQSCFNLHLEFSIICKLETSRNLLKDPHLVYRSLTSTMKKKIFICSAATTKKERTASTTFKMLVRVGDPQFRYCHLTKLKI